MLGQNPSRNTLPEPRHWRSKPLQAAWRQEHRTANRGRKSTLYSGAHEARAAVCAGSTAFAFDENHLMKLEVKKACIKCDLSGADLSNRVWSFADGI